jgi:hypothetical protein
VFHSIPSLTIRPQAVLPAPNADRRPHEGRDSRDQKRWKNAKLHALLRKIAAMLLELPENSQELRIAHASLQNIHPALARPAPAARPS